MPKKSREGFAYQVVVGTREDIEAGRGETAMISTEAAHRLGISTGRLSQMLKEEIIFPVIYIAGAAFYLDGEVEALRQRRSNEG